MPGAEAHSRWMNTPAYRQLMAGTFLDVLAYTVMHNLTADPFISRMVDRAEEHKEVLYFPLFAAVCTPPCPLCVGSLTRNIRKLRKTIQQKIAAPDV